MLRYFQIYQALGFDFQIIIFSFPFDFFLKKERKTTKKSFHLKSELFIKPSSFMFLLDFIQVFFKNI